VMKKRKKRWK